MRSPKFEREMKVVPATKKRLECSGVINQGEGYDYNVKLGGTISGCGINVSRPVGTMAGRASILSMYDGGGLWHVVKSIGIKRP